MLEFGGVVASHCIIVLSVMEFWGLVFHISADILALLPWYTNYRKTYRKTQSSTEYRGRSSKGFCLYLHKQLSSNRIRW